MEPNFQDFRSRISAGGAPALGPRFCRLGCYFDAPPSLQFLFLRMLTQSSLHAVERLAFTSQKGIILFLCVTFFFLKNISPDCKLQPSLSSSTVHLESVCFFHLQRHPHVSPYDIFAHLRHCHGLHCCPITLKFTPHPVARGDPLT